jgi:DNA-directed RNA polymerase subunit RPC12/RpoP
MSVADQVLVACSVCGRKFSVDPSASDRRLRCPCGQVMLVPAQARQEIADDPYELAEDPAPAAPTPKHNTIAASKDDVLARLGRTYVAQKKLGPDEAETLAAERRLDAILDPSPLREIWIPIGLLAIGLALTFCDVMYASRNAPHSAVMGAMLSLMRAGFSTALIVGGIFLCTVAFDVCIIGDFKRSILRICGIAIAPSALYGILSYCIGDVAGSTTGTVASILAYGLLFHFLLNLDLKDTSICVLVTWILITAVNYAAYKVQGAQTSSWV